MHSFVFTWLDGTPLEVPMSDILDTSQLGYQYDYLDVFRATPPTAVAAQASPQPLPPIASQTLTMPLAIQSVSPNERKYLEISGVQSPTEPITVGVFVKPSNAPNADQGIEIGTFAAVNTDGRVVWPSDRLAFDITAVARQHGGQEITVQLVPSASVRSLIRRTHRSNMSGCRSSPGAARTYNNRSRLP
jgi:hypothetical protein